MTKRERSIDFKGLKLSNKYPPFLFFAFILLALSLAVFFHKKAFIRGNVENDKTRIEPLSIESTRVFYSLAQSLQHMGVLRCDAFLPDPLCPVNPEDNPGQKLFYELRHGVRKTETGGFLPNKIPPHHTLKSLVVHTGKPDAPYVGTFLYTGENSGDSLGKILHLLEVIFDKNNRCENPLFQKWIFLEDPYAMASLRETYETPKFHDRIQVYAKDKDGKWSVAVTPRDNLVQYVTGNPGYLPCR